MTRDSRILIVEDEGIVAVDLKQMLEKLGYVVLAIANNGKDAIKKIGEANPDLILMDIVIKGEMDGIETAQQIRVLYDIPVIYTTAYFDDAILERAKITRPYGYIVKPFYEGELISSIEMAVHNHQMDQKLKKIPI